MVAVHASRSTTVATAPRRITLELAVTRVAMAAPGRRTPTVLVAPNMQCEVRLILVSVTTTGEVTIAGRIRCLEASATSVAMGVRGPLPLTALVAAKIPVRMTTANVSV
jgi:hypothetical protein